MITLLSPAKINLFLKIHGRRSDGYHEITTLIQAINFFDEITISHSPYDAVSTDHKDVPDGPENLAYIALQLIKNALDIHQCYHIEIKKNIPPQAGLGGGSSNAATVLWGINLLHGFPLTGDHLKVLGANIGSDVPFFFSVGTALCTGRGEKVEDQKQIKLPSITLALPSISVCTKEVYSHFKESAKSTSDYFNDLETPAFYAFPKLQKAKKSLERGGYTKVLMSGSGSSFICFGDVKAKINEKFKLKKCIPIQRENKSWY